jgi:hypothetical protein
MSMRKAAVRILPISTVLGMAGLLVAGALVTNCGGSQGVRTGTAGNAGTAGTTGAAGTGPGTAGTTGSGGSGTGGSGTPYSCSPASALDCTGAGLITFTATTGDITNFSSQEWSNTAGKWCDATGLRGSVFGYNMPTVDDAGVSIGGSAAGDNTAHNLKLTLGVAPGSYAGGGLSFDSCVAVPSTFTKLTFTATIESGSLDGCVWQVSLQTQDQRPTDQNSPPGGLCDKTLGSCFNYPAVMNLPIPAPGTTPTPYTLALSSFTASVAPTKDPTQQIVGIQWQANSAAPPDGGSQIGCNVVLGIDDIAFM